MKTETYVIEATGGNPAVIFDPEDFLFHHLVLSDKKEYEKEELKELAKTHDVDFISKEEEGSFTFLHVTSPEHLDSIREHGLKPSEDGYVGDLGYGVYLIDEDDTEAIENLLDYLEASLEDDEEEVLLIQGSYTGAFTRCIYGEGHEGYIVIKEIIIADCIEDWAVKNLDDVWFNGLSI